MSDLENSEIRKVILVDERNRSEKPSLLSKIETGAKIVSILLIPVLVAVLGSVINDTISKRALSQEYVKIAISILNAEEGTVDSALREWAVELLNQNSPTPFTAETRQRLATGEIGFSPTLQALLVSPEFQGSSILVSPDGTQLLTGHLDGSIRIHDIATGSLISEFRGHTDAISGLALSPDGARLVSASFDGTIRIWSVSTGEAVFLSAFDDIVTGIAIAPDGLSIFGRTRAGEVLQFDASTGEQMMRLTLPE